MSSNGKRDEDGDRPDLEETSATGERGAPSEGAEGSGTVGPWRPGTESDPATRDQDGTPIEDAEIVGEDPATARDDAEATAGTGSDQWRGEADQPDDADAARRSDDTFERDADPTQTDVAGTETATDTATGGETIGESRTETLERTGYAATGEDPGAEGRPGFTERMRAERMDPEPAAAAAATQAPPSSPQRSRGGFFPALLGGLIAAGIGFGVAWYVQGGFEPEEPDPTAEAVQAQGTQLSALEDQIARIADRLSQPEEPDPTGGQIDALSGKIDESLGNLGGQMNDLASSIGSVGDRLGNVESRLGQVDDRLTAVEKRPLVESSEAARQAFSAYERELEELRGSLSEQQQQNQTLSQQLDEMTTKAQSDMSQIEQRAGSLQQQAEQASRQGAIREALAMLNATLARGEPFAGPLQVLASNGVEIPEALSNAAGSGVASMSELRSSFPAAARAALDASLRSTAAESADVKQRFAAFLRNQTGARSLAPLEGDHPDAVLSRAEASLTDGDLQAALTELQALPEAGQQELSEWVQKAQARLSVTEAADGLSSSALAN